VSALTIDTEVTVIPWSDPVHDHQSHSPRSPYVETFWLPVLGPTALWAVRFLADFAETATADPPDAHCDGDCHPPHGATIGAHELAVRLGLANSAVTPPSLARTLARLCQFSIATPYASGIAVRTRLPWVPERHISRFPSSLRRQHELERQALTNTDPDDRKRARSVALTLLRLGDSDIVVRNRLESWNLSPRTIEEAINWATHRHNQPPHPEAT
jgi:hypothetical protein